MAEGSYQTVPLGRYRSGFRAVAEKIARQVKNLVPPRQVKQEKGSYSIVGTSSQKRVAKIIIYEGQLGRKMGRWPLRNDGVYILIRANGQAARNIWDDITPDELPWFFERMNREETIAIAPNHRERFAYLPVMAGESLRDIAVLLRACASA